MMRNMVVTGLVSVIMGIFTIAYTSLVPPDRRPAMASAGADAGMAPSQATAPMASPEGVRLFVNRIQPLLAARCFRCHNATARSGGLDLTTRAGALAGGETGDAIVLGKPSESLLVQLVTAGEMPKEGPPLSKLEIAELKRWIALGAPYADSAAMAGGAGSGSGAMGSVAGSGSSVSVGMAGAMGNAGGMQATGGMNGMAGMKMCPCMQMMMGMGGAGGMGGGNSGAGSAATVTPATGLSNPRTPEQARQRAEAHLKGLGNPNLKTGEVRETLATFEVQVVTKDGSPVNWIIIEKKTGRLTMLY